MDSLRKGTDRMAGNGGELGGVDDDEGPIQGLLGVAGQFVLHTFHNYGIPMCRLF